MWLTATQRFSNSSVPNQPDLSSSGQHTESHGTYSPLSSPAIKEFSHVPGRSPHNNMHPAVIMQRIKGARSLFGLNAAWHACQHAVTTVHLTAALLHLAKLSESRALHSGNKAGHTVEPLLQSILQQLRSQLLSLDACGLANTVQALGMLQHQDHQLLQELLIVSLPLLPKCTAAQLTAIIRGLAQLHFKPPGAWRDAFYTEALLKVSNLPTQPVESSTQHGRPELQQQQHVPALVQQDPGSRAGNTASSSITRTAPVAQRTLGVLRHSNRAAKERNSCVVGSLWGLHLLSCKPPTAWIKGMLDNMQLQQADAAQLSGVMYALARLRYVPPAAFSATVMQVCWQQLCRPDRDQQQQQPEGGEEELQQNTCAWQLTHLLQLLWGLSQLRLAVQPGLLQVLYSSMMPGIHAARPQEQVMLLQAVSQAQLSPQFYERWVLQQRHTQQKARSSGLQHSHRRFQQLHTAQHIAAATIAAQQPHSSGAPGAAAHTKQQRQQPLPSYQSEQHHIQPHHEAVQTDDMVLQQLHNVRTLLVRRTLTKALDSVEHLSMRDAVCMLVYCGRLRMGLHRFWMRTMLRSVILPNMRTASPPDVALTAYSLSRLRYRVGATVPQAILRASQHQLHLFSPQELGNLCWGLQGMRAAPSNSWLIELGKAIIKAGPRLQAREVHQLASALPRLACRPAHLRALAAQFWQLQDALSLLQQKCEAEQVSVRLHSILGTGSVNLRELQAYATVPRHRARRFEGKFVRHWRATQKEQLARTGLKLGRGRTAQAAAALGRSRLFRSLLAMHE